MHCVKRTALIDCYTVRSRHLILAYDTFFDILSCAFIFKHFQLKAHIFLNKIPIRMEFYQIKEYSLGN